MSLRQISSTLPVWQQRLMGLVVVIAMLGIWWRLGEPAEYVFDERYHVPAARAVLSSDWRIFDWWQPPKASDGTYADWLHPPLFKYLQASSIFLLGDRPLAWRFPSALAGMALIWLVWQLGLVLGDKKTSWWGVTLMSLSGLFLVQARTGMNDLVATCFGLAGLLFYTKFRWQIKSKWWLVLTGLFLGLNLATKWSAVWLWGAVGTMEIVSDWKIWLAFHRERSARSKKLWQNLKLSLPLKIVSLVLLPVMIYIASFWPVFISGRGLTHLINLHQNIWQYHLTRDKLHPDQSNPLDWLLNFQPVHYWMASVTPEKTTARITTIENPVLALGLTLSLGFWLGWKIISLSRSKPSSKNLKSLSQIHWLGWIFLATWVPNFFSPRILFQYHFLPALPLGIILMASAMMRLIKSWQLQLGILGGIFLVWLIFYPNWTGLPVSLKLAEQVYWFLPSWY